ncbi:MAG: UDP-N-acetylmuramate dehydrogenase [Candidatus Electrothrix aestuarii]|uniref:UDP-N-acetylenolpyruvoylglucosamine reductase n=1 Tax=Candidatus Electrothrix aestuarii TaxID=3062594 RepID=A0AAU8LYI4_9BACT|nr:UDP-N-acetylmuramate dehydrogenase [Candidatus Electrothrix aestuarii]
MNQQQRELLAELVKDWPTAIQFDVSMASYSTLRAGGKAAALIDVYSLADLRFLLEQLHEEQLVFRVIGRGSNILVTDKGFPGVIIRLKGEFEQIELAEDARRGDVVQEGPLLKVGGGCSLARFLSWCTQQGLAGLEFMTGIPGSVGGAVRMNAGALGGEIGDRLQSLVLLDGQGKIITVPRSDLHLSYRKAELADKDLDALIIAFACFVLRPDTQEEIRSRCAGLLAQRKGKQPAGVASAGSFFKNPSGDAAGRLIEAAGLKGHYCGEAMVSPVHANFIVNTGKGTVTDILNLMELVQDRVFQKFAVRLEPEVEII